MLAQPLVGRHALDKMLEEIRANDLNNRHEHSFLYLFHYVDDVLQVAKRAHQTYFKMDRMAPTAFPSKEKFEKEIVETVVSLSGGGEEASGSITTSGTDSIFLALKSACDWARDTKPHTDVPKIVVPYKANPAFNKAEQNLGLKVLRIDEREDFRAGVPAIADAIGCTWTCAWAALPRPSCTSSAMKFPISIL